MIIDLPTPTRVVFGRGRLTVLGAETARWGRRALVVCGRTAMRRHGVLTAVATNLGEAGLGVTVFDQVSEDPLAVEVDAAVATARRAGCDVVVGLGGGSAIDAAKAVGVGLRRGPVAPLIGDTLPDDPDATPVLAVPTIAGSGAEVTKGAIITDPGRRLKAGIRGDQLFPRTAVVDPDLLRTVPAAAAAVTAFDALTHAVEGHVARRADDVSRALAARALRLLARRLPEVASGASDAGLRDDLALVSLLGGMSVARVSTCLPHRLQQAMGSVEHVRISHGRGLAAVYPAWLRHAEPHAPDRFAEVAAVLDTPDIAAAILALRRAAGLDRTLSSYGFTERDTEILVNGVVGNIDNDPIPDPDQSTISAIYRESL